MIKSIDNRSPGMGQWKEDDDKHSIELPEKRRNLSAENLSDTLREKDQMEDDILDRIDSEKASAADEEATPIRDLIADEIESIDLPDDSPMAHEVMGYKTEVGADVPADTEVADDGATHFDILPTKEGIHKKAIVKNPEHAFLHRQPQTDFHRVRKQQTDKRDKKQAA